MTELLGHGDDDTSFYPVKLTLGEPTPVYALKARKRQTTQFELSPALVQELASIERSTLKGITLGGLPRRIRNNLCELAAQLPRLAGDSDWRSMLAESLDLTTLLREFYYRSARRGGASGVELRVLCTPRDGEAVGAAIDDVAHDADLEMRLAFEPGDLQPEQTRIRKLRIRLTPQPAGGRDERPLFRHRSMSVGEQHHVRR